MLRYASHVLSGTFAFGKYAVDEGYVDKFLLYALAYNSFTLVDLAIDLAAGILLLLSPAFRRQMDITMQTRVVEENGEIFVYDGETEIPAAPANSSDDEAEEESDVAVEEK